MTAQRLDGRVAIVTGAARGIGAAIAQRLAAEGAAVVVADIEAELAGEVSRAISDSGATAIGKSVDIADEASVGLLAEFVNERWGRCDILVNNAAILDVTDYDALTMERLRRVLDVNLLGAVHCTRAVVPIMRRGGWGRIVNVGSIMGERGSRSSIPYSLAKAGIANLTRCLACDLAPDGIVVNAVAPGFIDTRMAILPDGSGHEHESEWFKDIYLKHGRIPLRRAGLPEDVASVTFFLCSDDCRYVTGQILQVDGGISATF